jgi:hypothetical protein
MEEFFSIYAPTIVGLLGIVVDVILFYISYKKK